MDNLALIVDSVSTICLVVLAIVTLSWKFSQRNQGELQEVRDSINEIKNVLFDINGRLGRVEGQLASGLGSSEEKINSDK
ncbi:MAG: hypothetical protein OXD39_05810 [Gemmatimonadetes bacterium]|nr:hypothetical protein [Gemmatimonadota bacterium]